MGLLSKQLEMMFGVNAGPLAMSIGNIIQWNWGGAYLQPGMIIQVVASGRMEHQRCSKQLTRTILTRKTSRVIMDTK